MHNVKYSRKYKNQNDTVFKFLLYSLAPFSVNDFFKDKRTSGLYILDF